MAILRDPILPPFQSADGRNEEDELIAQAEAGLQSRLVSHVYDDVMSDEDKEAAGEALF